MRTAGMYLGIALVAFGPCAMADEVIVKEDVGRFLNGPFGLYFVAGNCALIPQSESRERDIRELPRFHVYRTDEVDSKLQVTTARIAALENKETTDAATLNNDVKKAVTSALMALPAQLFSEEQKRALIAEISANLEASLGARVEAMKQELEGDILTKVQDMLTHRP